MSKTQASLDRLADKYRDKYELELSKEDKELMERVAGGRTGGGDDGDEFDDEFDYAFEEGGGTREEVSEVPPPEKLEKEKEKSPDMSKASHFSNFNYLLKLSKTTATSIDSYESNIGPSYVMCGHMRFLNEYEYCHIACQNQ